MESTECLAHDKWANVLIYILLYKRTTITQREHPNRYKAAKSWREKRQGFCVCPNPKAIKFLTVKGSFLSFPPPPPLSLLLLLLHHLPNTLWSSLESSQQALLPAILPYASVPDNCLAWGIQSVLSVSCPCVSTALLCSPHPTVPLSMTCHLPMKSL